MAGKSPVCCRHLVDCATVDQADFAILNEIYDVAGRKYKEDEKISSKAIVDQINKNNMIYSADFEQTKKLIYKNIKTNDLLLIMGAGDIDNLARNLHD